MTTNGLGLFISVEISNSKKNGYVTKQNTRIYAKQKKYLYIKRSTRYLQTTRRRPGSGSPARPRAAGPGLGTGGSGHRRAAAAWPPPGILSISRILCTFRHISGKYFFFKFLAWSWHRVLYGPRPNTILVSATAIEAAHDDIKLTKAEVLEGTAPPAYWTSTQAEPHNQCCS